MAKHIPLVLMRYNNMWNDVTSSVSQNSAVKITTGQPDLGQSLRAAKIELTFEDPDGTFRPYLPTSALYGLAGRNTPLLVGHQLGFEGFESLPLSVTVSQGTSTNPWARSTTSPRTGSWCFKSGVTADSATSDAIVTVPTGSNYCMGWLRTDSAAGDALQILTGGQVRYQLSGVGGAWFQFIVPVYTFTPNPNQVVFRYLKDAAGSGGADAVYIDDLIFFRSPARAEITAWEPDQSVDYRASPKRGDRWTDITAYGVTNRLSTWVDTVQSAMTRTVLQFSTLVGFWPGEDDPKSAGMSNLAPRGVAGTIVNAEFGDDHSPGGGATSIALHSNTSLRGRFNRTPTGAGWQISRALKLAAAPASSTGQSTLAWVTTNGYVWRVDVSNGAYTLNVADSAGTVLLASATSYTTQGDPTQWVTLRVKASVSGGTVTAETAWYREGAGASEGATDTFPGTIGALDTWSVTGGSYLDGGWLAYVYGVSGTADDLLTTVRQSFNGYVGETAATRFSRLMTEAGLGWETQTLSGYVSMTMGPQRPDTLLNLLLEIQATDGGILTDAGNALGIIYRSRHNLYRQTPALSLTYGVNVAPPLKPILDTQDAFNQVTVDQRNGSSFVTQDDVSLMGTQAPPLGIGLQKQTLDVNVSSESLLPGIGQWALGLGTVADTRYTAITVDLDASPGLEAAAVVVRPGDRIQVAALESDVVDLMVLGVSDVRAEATRRTISFTCAPYRQYQVAVYDETAARYDSASTVANVAYNTTATAVVFRTSDPGDTWSTTATPYDVFCAGERWTVTSMGAVSGTVPSLLQSATVTRSVNGVVKAIPAGSSITVATPARYAL